MSTLLLPVVGGALAPFTLSPAKQFAKPTGAFNRIALSAAHVVADPFADTAPWLSPAAIDWDKTIAYRRYLWSLGLGVAEAMDTAQRGMGLNWSQAQDLIRRSLEAAQDFPGTLVFSGAGTDHLDPAGATLDDVIAAYETQCETIEALGGRIILMASRALAKAAARPEDYAVVYGRILRQVKQPVILHWLGDMFDSALTGYWGTTEFPPALELCLQIIAEHADKVDGIKISLLDKEKEVQMRRRLPPGVKMYTGDDFNYAELIGGDAEGFSHALLGIFDAIAPAASAALSALAAGDRAEFEALLAPTVPLSRHIFKAPTQFYKTGVVFMAYLNGHQDHFTMIGGHQSARSLVHLAEVFRLADAAGLLNDPEQAAHRMRQVLAVHGVEV